METTNAIVSRCKSRTVTCPKCQEPTRSMQCSLSEHPPTIEHDFPTKYGHLPPFGDGGCPNVFKKLSLNQITILREAYVDWYMCRLLVDRPEAMGWTRIFNPPLVKEPRGTCSEICPMCRIEDDPRTKDIIRMIFMEYVEIGKHPQFGYNLVDVMQELKEAWKAERA